jgi:oxygen-dependent protoporphyrinogen oxidase
VLLAAPAAASARLLAASAPAAAERLAALPAASVATVGLLLPPIELPPLSGLLVQQSVGYATKAVTFVDRKWGSGGELTRIRASVGRFGAAEALEAEDEELTRRVLGELEEMIGAPLPLPRASVVTRWWDAMPQYGVGHRAVMAQVRAACEELPPLALAGAPYDGIGIASCVASAREAARLLAGEAPLRTSELARAAAESPHGPR